MANTGCNPDILPYIRGVDKHLHITKYTKNFTVTGYDCPTEEIYEGTNDSSKSFATGLKIIAYGGSSLKIENLRIEAYQVVEEFQKRLAPTLSLEKERLKLFLIPFMRPLTCGQKFKIIYRDFWPNCMRYGVDAIIYSEPLLYERSIEQIESRITFDVDVVFIRAYSYDLDSNRWELDEDQPRAVSDSRSYVWTKSHPSCCKIYLIVFDRPANHVITR